MSQFASCLKDDGNIRVAPTLFNLPNCKLCVINCYLSSYKNAAALIEYQMDLLAVEELLKKYGDGYSILICGDFNADIYSRDGEKEKLLRKFILSNQLMDLGHSTRQQHTYSHVFKSHIDHMFVHECPTAGATWSPKLILSQDDDYRNTSTHVPVTTSLQLPGNTLPKSCPIKHSPRKKILWQDMNHQLYEQTVQQELRRFDISLLPPGYATLLIQNILLTAEAAAVPTKVTKTPKNRKPWCPELEAAIQHSKVCLFNWKESGRPEERDHPASIARRRARRQVRTAQRHMEAEQRIRVHENIMQAHAGDKNKVYSLVARSRSRTEASGLILQYNGTLHQDESSIRNAWAEYFNKLSNPTNSPMVHDDVIEGIRGPSSRIQEPFSTTLLGIHRSIQQLNTKKAADIYGLQAEHLKFSVAIRIPLLHLINDIGASGSIPEEQKKGYKLPIPKKGKDAKLPDNHRGITITPSLGKLLEHVILHASNEDFSEDQHAQQYGFTQGLSPILATLSLTECIADAKAKKKPLYVATLDASKAFDVVDHNMLRLRLQSIVPRRIWRLLDNLLSNCTDVVRVSGQDSHPFPVTQGVRQGGVLSTHLYKIYVNPLLRNLEDSQMQYEIDNIPAGTPTCADDVLLIAQTNPNMQGLLNISWVYSKENGYGLHPVKSTVAQLCKGKSANVEEKLFLGDAELQLTNQFCHLGLQWKSDTASPDLSQKIDMASRAAYSLMGSGLHGTDGCDPKTSLHLLNTYVTPVLLFGLEAVILRRKDITNLDTYYKKMLRCIQGLPDTTATEALYLLSGVLPIEAQLHIRILTLFGAVASLEENAPLRALALKRLSEDSSIPVTTPNSWFSYCNTIAVSYDINLLPALTAPWVPHTWKKHVRSIVTTHWKCNLQLAASSKSSLSRLLLDHCPPTGPHPVWTSCGGRSYKVKAAMTRAKMLAGRFILQADRARFNQFAVDPTCKLCDSGPEDMTHFIATCPALQEAREQPISDFMALYQASQITPPTTDLELCSAVLNGGPYQNSHDRIPEDKNNIFQQLASHICHRLHRERDIAINNLLMDRS